MEWPRHGGAWRADPSCGDRESAGRIHPGTLTILTLDVTLEGPLQWGGLPRTDQLRVLHLPKAICGASELLSDTHASRHGGGEFLSSMLTVAAGGDQRGGAGEERCCFYVYSYLVDEQETDTRA